MTDLKYKYNHLVTVPLDNEHLLKQAVRQYKQIKGNNNKFIYMRNPLKELYHLYSKENIDMKLLKHLYDELKNFIKEEDMQL